VKEKELRLALVCFGGISLAVYIHGVTKEILHLARASRTYHADPDLKGRESLRYDAAGDAAYATPDTEPVYLDLLKAIGRGLDLRVVVDVIAGASAGGINGIILARALGHDLPIDHLRDLWLKEADVTELMAEKAEARIWSKWYMRPLIAAVLRLRFHEVARDRELRRKLSAFLRSRWFKPPFDGEHLSELLLDGIGAMGAPREAGASLLPSNQRLDLFITVTDFFGYLRRIRLHDPPAVTEREHRHVLRFHYLRQAGGDEETDFDLENLPGLAFAGRASASVPGAFPPVQIGEIDRLLTRRSQTWPARERFLQRNFARYRRAGLDPAASAFVDGSVTNNKPFAEAITAIQGRPAQRQVDRRLVYVEPHPAEFRALQTGRVPGFLRTLRGVLSDIPRNEPVHDELAWINGFNQRVRRMKTIVEAARPQIGDLVGRIAKGRLGRKPSGALVREWRDAANAMAARESGFAYEGYARLKVVNVIDNVANLLATALGLDADDRRTVWIAEVLTAWGRERGMVPEEGPIRKAKKRVRESKRPRWISLLLSFDFEFRRRRLHFVIQRLNELYGRLGEPEFRDLSAEQLDALKQRFYEALGLFRAPHLAQRLEEPVRAEAETLIAGAAPDVNDPDMLADLAGVHAAHNLDRLDALIERLAGAIDLTEADRHVDDIFATAEAWIAPARRELLISYIGFSFWDVLTFSVTQWRDLGEFEEIRVDRISPDDANALRPGGARATLKGVGFGHFGAFFSRAARENDYLWGRLHAADRLIDIVCDTARHGGGGIRPDDIAAFKRRAFAAILDAEAPHLPRCAALIAELRAELGQ
jgi:patatin-related protein